MTDLNLDRMEELEQAATEGPWEAECYDGEGSIVEVNAGSALTQWTDHGNGIKTGRPARSWTTTDRIMEREDLYDEDFDQAEADAEFIAEMRNAAPALLARVRELEATVEKVRALHRRDPYIPEGKRPWCVCEEPWPCPTIEAIGGDEENGDHERS